MLKILGGLCDVQAPVDILRVIKNCIVFNLEKIKTKVTPAQRPR